jgi:hypothetical protein
VYRFNAAAAGRSGTITTVDSFDSSDDERFSPLFTLRDMERLAGFKIQWTDNLSNHLLVKKELDGRFLVTLYVYSNTTLLERNRGRYIRSCTLESLLLT